ncbi:MAG TPA: protein phosphatase 2C domain-containing protein [Blastocatellia bacterium]|nr:protein phosphatase 2C domain-containing protein [Blastocatellia bacterium]
MVTPTNIETRETLIWVSARTDIGMKRASNEDSMLVADLATGRATMGADMDMDVYEADGRGMLMAISDGMGGEAAGEVASHIAITVLHEALLRQTDDLDIEERLKMAVELANIQVWTRAQADSALTGMGTALTAALVQGGSAYVAQIGHSRAYLIRDDMARQITVDQTLAQALVDRGAINAYGTRSILKNILTQAIGASPVVQAALISVEICPDDHLLICSNGLSNKVAPNEISLVIQQSANLTDACGRLIEIANERGGEDNITVMLARMSGAAHSLPIAGANTGRLKLVA